MQPRHAGRKVFLALIMVAALVTACSTSGTPTSKTTQTAEGSWSWLGPDRNAITNGQYIYDASGGQYISDVSCISPTLCIAVGGTYAANGVQTDLAVTFNGNHWSPDRLPTVPFEKGLTNVSCSHDRFCMAIDSVSESFFSFDGRHWTASPLNFGLNPAIYQYTGASLSCPTRSSCVAANNIGIADVFEHGTWQPPVRPFSAAAFTAWCPDTPSCLVEGPNGSWVLTGGAWSATSASTAPAMSCVGQGTCSVSSEGAIVPPTPTPGLVSCASHSFCMSIGSAIGPAEFSYAVFRGRSWSAPHPIPHIAYYGTEYDKDGNGNWDAVLDCISADSCILIGPTGATWVWGTRK